MAGRTVEERLEGLNWTALDLNKRELAVSAVNAKLRVAAQQSENDRFPNVMLSA
ncbi:hypothetical protein MKK68_00025 [Methylobacterium sp. E-016]|uniref:hypothetical protein n=1 Tax=Methylobacterium sp. E-016 TaxID=2836556 RepID=UPI001FBAACCF|nr:hypothetical protein [Methylobacterium sp. E-016]MCJ2074058.1 hypothetical protein [Methylobacterium sp. E-016]